MSAKVLSGTPSEKPGLGLYSLPASAGSVAGGAPAGSAGLSLASLLPMVFLMPPLPLPAPFPLPLPLPLLAGLLLSGTCCCDAADFVWYLVFLFSLSALSNPTHLHPHHPNSSPTLPDHCPKHPPCWQQHGRNPLPFSVHPHCTKNSPPNIVAAQPCWC